MPHHMLLTTSDNEVSLGGQLTKVLSSDDEMADDESTKQNTLGNDLSCHTDQHTPPAAQEAEDNDDDAMFLGGYTDNEAEDSHPFSMLEMQANISNISNRE
ncbi:hypothetical protein BDN71DRAFT_1433102 [Pleurotus eryngii]|uniref:Uncharacterized protein n=1 Tax=Pleurotus eryngii TaxID=5323 RepID=A0A9P5ZTX5_PLEER|nr:hypothetical protein BDN71DRAFT_1433102 [Pleurotus eryngii]